MFFKDPSINYLLLYGYGIFIISYCQALFKNHIIYLKYTELSYQIIFALGKG